MRGERWPSPDYASRGGTKAQLRRETNFSCWGENARLELVRKEGTRRWAEEDKKREL